MDNLELKTENSKLKTVNYYPDFFNDVFGPVMQPGSSSHTAGPCRIGYLAGRLAKGKIKDITVRLDKNGSFAGTFGHMSEDLGMLAGAYGLLPDDERMFIINDLLDKEGITRRFDFTDLPAFSHPNAVQFVITDENGEKYTLSGNSTGGGMIETTEINGIPFRFLGDCYLTCIKADKAPEADGILTEKRDGLIFIRSERPAEIKDAEILFSLPPVLPVTSLFSRQPQLFDSMAGWREYAEKNGMSLSEAAMEYEKRASGMSEEEITEKMKELRSYMKAQTEYVYSDESRLFENPFTGYHFRDWKKYTDKKTPVSGSLTPLALRYAFGVQAQSMGVKLVPGPMGTGGGYLYSAVRAVKETNGFSDEKELEGLFVAAGVGAICYTRTNPTGEITGCTGECGVCCAMASAAITHMAGGTPLMVENAASLALQTALGWPCDPIPGAKNQPCIGRVVTAVMMAPVFADMALSGKDAVIPFHEVVDEADRFGKEMPAKLKCTSCGGMCETPTGEKCKKEFAQWHETGFKF